MDSGLLAIAGLVVGITALAIGIPAIYWQWQSARRDKGYQVLLERAQKEWHGQYSHQQVKQLTRQFLELQNSIAKDVPATARQVFLKDQLANLESAIVPLFQEWNHARKQLNKEIRSLPPQIRSAIENELLPSYIHKEHRQLSMFNLVKFLVIQSLASLALTITISIPSELIYIAGFPQIVIEFVKAMPWLTASLVFLASLSIIYTVAFEPGTPFLVQLLRPSVLTFLLYFAFALFLGAIFLLTYYYIFLNP